MKLGAVILVAGVGIPDEEMEKFLEMLWSHGMEWQIR